MSPAFATTRPRLPSILSVFQPIEQYQTGLRQQSMLLAAVAADLEPLDAYLVHLLMNVHPGEPAILDLTAEATGGASTLLGLLHPRQPRVYAAGGPLPGDRHSYRGGVEEFLQRQGKSFSLLHWLPHAEPAAELRGETDVIVFVSRSRLDADAEVEQWLNVLPSALVLVFGLGAVGDCPTLDALVQRFPTGSPRRLALLRDSGEVLSASRLGLVTNRDNAAAEIALRRLKQLFTSNYSFLGLLRSATEQAIGATESDAAARESSAHFLAWNQEINQLKKAAQQGSEDAGAAEELRAIKTSLGYRLSERFRRWRKQLAPDRTLRYRLFNLLRRVGQIWRREGVLGLFSRVVRRCVRLQS
ncbi:MAG TPA: hypothetical protein VMF69_00945 [Gemmataceae bacterium]|nr:hypothetical protein [Gemmataceae bacterium]